MEKAVSGMVDAQQKLLVPLNTNGKAAGWNLDCLDNPVTGIGACNDRRRELRDGLAVKRIHLDCLLANDRRQT